MRLSRIVPARVYSSPLKRAFHTAEIIMENNSGDTVIDSRDDLMEISFGLWEGLTVPEIKEVDAVGYEAWSKTPFSAVPGGGESLEEVGARTCRCAKMMKEAGGPGDVTFVVAHAVVLRALIAALMDIEGISLFWRLRFDNCSISVLDMWGTRPSLLLTNDTHHIRLKDEEIRLLTFPE